MYYGYSTITWEKKGISLSNIGMLWAFAIISEILIFMTINYFFKNSYLNKSLLFCSLITFIRWILTYYVENFYFLLIIQTLHGVTFALTHYIMIFYINIYLKESLRLYAQTVYYVLTGGLFITIFSISCGYITSYSKGDEGYLLMSFVAFLSFLYLIMRGKAYV